MAHQIPSTMPKAFLGSMIEICIVSSDIKRTIDGLSTLGIGPFKIYDFNSKTVTHRTFRGQASDFELRVAFAQQGDMTWEIMQPISRSSIMAEYLDKTGDGVQHVAFACNGVPMEDRVRMFKERGFEVVMSGVWKGKRGECEFIFFDTEGKVGTVVETIGFSDNWEEPDEIEIYPAQP